MLSYTALRYKKLECFSFARQKKGYEKLEWLEHEQYVAERKINALQNKKKWLLSEVGRLTRSERTHRLCTRAGMLESFLKEPSLLTDDDVMELLSFIFRIEEVQGKLDELIEMRIEEMENELDEE